MPYTSNTLEITLLGDYGFDHSYEDEGYLDDDDFDEADYDDFEDDEFDMISDFDAEEDEDEFFEIECPNCGEDVLINFDDIEEGIVCPHCEEEIELEFDTDSE